LEYCIKNNITRVETKYKIYFETRNLTGDTVMHDMYVTLNDIYRTKKYAAMKFLHNNGLDIGIEDL
jgi:23S rRNA U2552 (ribose-2'-O)-methylase RlmE/FtsJ